MYVNQEVDLYLYDAVSYFEKYGNLEEALDVGTINDEQYREIKGAVEWQGGIKLINDENRIKILNFLQWNDRHGCYTDGNCDLEEVPRFTYDEAVKYFFGVINDVFYYSKADNIFELSYAQVIEYAKENGFYDKTYMKLNELLSNPNPTDEFYYSLLNQYSVLREVGSVLNINFQFYPKNIRIPNHLADVVNVFIQNEAKIS